MRKLLCQLEEWKTEAPVGEIMAKRVQVPLILAWALRDPQGAEINLDSGSLDFRTASRI